MASEATKIPFIEAAAPSTPAATRVVIYAKSDGLMYSKDDAGAETLMSGGLGGLTDHNHTTGGDGGDLDAPVIDGYAIWNEESAPSTPGAATVAVYAKSDGLMYSKDDAGVETLMSGGTGGGLTHTTQGTTSDGGSDKTARGLYLKQLVLASDGLVSSIVAFIKGDATNVGTSIPVIYTDAANVPVNLIFQPPPNITTAPTRVVSTILNTTVREIQHPVGAWLAAGTYWFGVWLGAGADSRIILRYAAGAGSTNYIDASASQNEPVDISIQAGSTTSDNLGIYIHVLR